MESVVPKRKDVGGSVCEGNSSHMERSGGLSVLGIMAPKKEMLSLLERRHLMAF